MAGNMTIPGGGIEIPINTVEVRVTAKIYQGGRMDFHIEGSNPHVGELHPLACRIMLLEAEVAFKKQELAQYQAQKQAMDQAAKEHLAAVDKQLLANA